MLAALKPLPIVYNGLRLIKHLVTVSEMEILIRELENLTIFTGLKERADKRFMARPDCSIGSQIDIAIETIKF